METNIENPLEKIVKPEFKVEINGKMVTIPWSDRGRLDDDRIWFPYSRKDITSKNLNVNCVLPIELPSIELKVTKFPEKINSWFKDQWRPAEDKNGEAIEFVNPKDPSKSVQPWVSQQITVPLGLIDLEAKTMELVYFGIYVDPTKTLDEHGDAYLSQLFNIIANDMGKVTHRRIIFKKKDVADPKSTNAYATIVARNWSKKSQGVPQSVINKFENLMNTGPIDFKDETTEMSNTDELHM